jgi:preprotein translocase subunit SecB
MADETDPATTANGSDTAAEGGAPIEARVVAQFIKDLSFEVPNPERVVKGPAEDPNLKLEVNVNARQVEGSLFESGIEFSAKATDTTGTIYDLELTYTGMFEVKRMPQDALEPFLLVNCPAMIFPFLRRLVADLTRESGFPPLMIDPIDFGQLYMQRRQQVQQGGQQPS